MAAPSAQTLQRIAGQTGLQAATLEKVLRLLDLLQLIAEDRQLDGALVLKGGTALEVDLNYMARQPLFGLAPMASINLGGYRAQGVPVLDIHEIIAGKLVALFDRRAARDLFDARRILAMKGLDWSLIKAGVLAYGASGRRDWREASLDDISGEPRELRQKLAICLPRDRFTGAAEIKTWIGETVALCRAGLAGLLDLSDGEQAFLDGVIDRGEIDATGLDVPEVVRERIAAMPMLAWKCQNVRVHRTGGGEG